MTPKVVYRIYIAFYSVSTVMLLWSAWVDGGLKEAVLTFFLVSVCFHNYGSVSVF